MADGVIRELVTVLGFDVKDKDLAKFEKRVKDLGKTLKRMTIAAGVAVGTIGAIVAKTARFGDNVAKASKRLGLSVEELQKYRFAFQLAGVSAETFDMAIQRFGRRAAEAAKGQGEAVKALREMRIQLRDNEGNLRNLDDLLMDALDALGNVENQTDRNRLAMKLFDSEGVRLVQGLERGNKTLKANKQLLEDMGAVMSKETAKASEDLTDEWTIHGKAFDAVIFALGEVFLPLVTDVVKAISGWLKRHRTLAAVLVGFGIALAGIAAGIFAVIAVQKLWNIVLTKTAIKIGIIVGKIIAIPLLLAAVLAAAFMIGQDVGAFLFDQGDSVTGRLVAVLGRLWAGAKAVIWAFIDDVGKKIADAIWTSIPKPLRDLLVEDVSGPNLGQPEAVADPDRRLAFMRAAAGSIARNRNANAGGVGTVNITVNAAPGQSAGAIAAEVATQVAGVENASLSGLGR